MGSFLSFSKKKVSKGRLVAGLIAQTMFCMEKVCLVKKKQHWSLCTLPVQEQEEKQWYNGHSHPGALYFTPMYHAVCTYAQKVSNKLQYSESNEWTDCREWKGHFQQKRAEKKFFGPILRLQSERERGVCHCPHTENFWTPERPLYYEV